MIMRMMTAILLAGLLAESAGGHCDTMSGPVVGDARKALDTRDSSWVLIWVRPSEEGDAAIGGKAEEKRR